MKVVRLTELDLKKVGLSVVTWRPALMLQCDICGYTFPAVERHGAILKHDFWVCPRQCNIWPDLPEPEAYTPKPEPEPEQDLLDQEIAKLMKDYAFYANEAKLAKSQEARRRFEAEAERTLDRWLEQLDIKNTLELETMTNEELALNLGDELGAYVICEKFGREG